MRPSTLVLVLAALLTGCGTGDTPPPGSSPIGGGTASEAQDAPAAVADNRPPVIRRVNLRPTRPLPGSIVAADVDAFDPDGDEVTLSYAWTIDGAPTGGNEATILLSDVSKASAIQVTVIARDAKAKSQSETVSTQIGNRPPMMLGVVIEPLEEVRTDQDVSANPRAQDPDSDSLEFRYSWTVNGVTVGGDAPILTANHYERGDEIRLRVQAYDGQDSSDPLSSAPFEVANAPPRITSTPGGFDTDGIFRYAVGAEDPDGDRSFRYGLDKAPTGMEIDVVSGELTWKPTPDQAGAHPVTIEVGDRRGGITTQSFDIRVEFEKVPEPAAPAL